MAMRWRTARDVGREMAPAAVSACEAWAAAGGWREVESARPCGHAVRRARCPGADRVDCYGYDHGANDHAQVWRRADGVRCMTAHVYPREDSREACIEYARKWAAKRGMSVVVDLAADWYGHGTIPLRYEAASAAKGAH